MRFWNPEITLEVARATIGFAEMLQFNKSQPILVDASYNCIIEIKKDKCINLSKTKNLCINSISSMWKYSVHPYCRIRVLSALKAKHELEATQFELVRIRISTFL